MSNFINQNIYPKDRHNVFSEFLEYFGNIFDIDNFIKTYQNYLTDDELLESFWKNEDELKKYPNYRSLFAFPFGQPDTCFSTKQIELILKTGAKKVFSTYPFINPEVTAKYLHRIPLHSFNNTKARIWFNILRRSFKL